MFEVKEEVSIYEEIIPIRGELTYTCIKLLELIEYENCEYVKYNYIKISIIN